VRMAASGELTGRRVMIERAPAEVALGVAGALAVSVPEPALALLEAARASGLPLIAGWDAADGDSPWAKLYLNASEASEALRRRALDRTGFPGLTALPGVPHLLALNFHEHGYELKAYLQAGDAVAASAAYGARAAELARAGRELGLDAGAVVSYRLDPDRGTPTPKAWFLALRTERSPAPLFERVGAFRETELDLALPFARGHCRSLGVPLAPGASGWTAYFKPKGAGAALFSLEPAATFQNAAFEVRVFVAPHDEMQRAYRRTERFAVSFTTPGEAPPVPLLEALMTWAVERVKIAEKAGVVAEPSFDTPPAPWTRVS
ncbi:MAG TPA: hypothetical protein VGK73_35455, partial [Polyangiaceae bacterium]